MLLVKRYVCGNEHVVLTDRTAQYDGSILDMTRS